MRYLVFDSILGKLTVASDGDTITQLHIEGDKYFTEIPSDWIQTNSDPLLLQAKQELTEYLQGGRISFSFPVATSGTPFQQKVWHALQSVPYGSTSSYATIAAQVGSPKAVRAVGTAIGKNPICIAIPCHRILTSTGGIGGYVAGIERKQAMLDLEAAA